MNARLQPASQDRPDTSAMLSAFAEGPRQQIAVATQATAVMFRGFETMRQIQERAAHAALARHASVTTRLKTPIQAVDLVLAHAQLMNEDVDATARCWQEVAAAALEMQGELAACCTRMVDSDVALQAAASLARR